MKSVLLLTAMLSVSSAAQVPTSETRQQIQLSAQQQQYLLWAMRELLQGTTQAQALLLEAKPKQAAIHLANVRASIKRAQPEGLRALLPNSFLMMQKAMNQQLNSITADSSELQIRRTLNKATQVCNACHQHFAFEVKNE